MLGGLVLHGCGESLPPVSDPSQARPILTSALDAWKRGERLDSLATGDPPVRVIDHQWQTGWSLAGYEIKGEGIRSGLNIQQPVALELKDPKGKTIKKTVNYLVHTGSPPVITREDLDGE